MSSKGVVAHYEGRHRGETMAEQRRCLPGPPLWFPAMQRKRTMWQGCWPRFRGPYDKAIEEGVAEVIVSGVGWGSTERYPLPSGKPGRYERLHVNGSIPFHFTLGQNAVLAHVTRNYVPMSRDELLQDVVYQTDPV